MNLKIKNISKLPESGDIVVVLPAGASLPSKIFSKSESAYIKEKRGEENAFFQFNHLSHQLMLCIMPEQKEDEEFVAFEKIRRLGNSVYKACKSEKVQKLVLHAENVKSDEMKEFVSGILLSSYSFDKYKSKKSDAAEGMKEVLISGMKLSKSEISEIEICISAVFMARNWINEPGSVLTPREFATQVEKLFSGISSIKTEIFSPKKISSLKMSGIDAVSKGGPNAPAFIVLEYIPSHLKKVNPIVLVGKGIFFDTGGINLKPGMGLADMKCDMSGAAAVAATMYAISHMKLDVPVVGLIPATENRPGHLAYLPGDVLTMMNGVSVEIKNTDAEGRLILADALCYASKYNPAVAITIATLTGSAHATFGPLAIAGMENKASFYFSLLKSTSFEVYERIAQLPMWNEYEEMIESQVADIQNVGGKYAGAITAAKFLQKFTDYPFIHLDIAGPAFAEKPDAYIPVGGTGVGVRLFLAFLKKLGTLQDVK